MSTPSRFASGPGQSRVSLELRLGRLLLLLFPAFLLLLASFRLFGDSVSLLWFGSVILALGGFLVLWSRQGGHEPSGPALIMLYVIALGWLLFVSNGVTDWVLYVAQAFLLVFPAVLFAFQCLRDSGATTIRRARQLASRLSTRRDWPADLSQCRHLPEVKALRESLHIDASPALELLANPHPSVRVAALAALEYRPYWRIGQPEVVLQLAQRAPEPAVRSAAINALANIDDRLMIESLCERLHDSAATVRATAAEAVLWNSEQRWEWVRHRVHQALGDPNLVDDGPFQLTGQALPTEVVEDLHAWCAEKGAVGLRAALTLGAYYAQQLATGAGPELLPRLRLELVGTKTPAILRLELARLLQQNQELTLEELGQLLSPTMPAPVRLIAADSLLARGSSNGQAVAALHDLARLPNREIALSTAQVVQNRLRVDLGLGQVLPAVQSRMAAEVARRLLEWSHQNEVQEEMPHGSQHSSSQVNLFGGEERDSTGHRRFPRGEMT